jgi:hypothetical protein
MTDAKREALCQALIYHNSTFGSALSFDKVPKKPSADVIVATAKKFEAFLDPQAKKR